MKQTQCWVTIIGQHKWYHYCYPTSLSLSLLTGHKFSCPHSRTRSYYLVVSHFIHAVLKFKLFTTTSVGYWSYNIPTECVWLWPINVPSHDSWPMNVSSPKLFQTKKTKTTHVVYQKKEDNTCCLDVITNQQVIVSNSFTKMI